MYAFDKARWITVGLQSCLDVIKFPFFQSFCNVRFYLNFLIDFLSFILPVEDCSSGSRKLVVFIILARDRFLNFNYVSSWLRPFNIFKKNDLLHANSHESESIDIDDLHIAVVMYVHFCSSKHYFN